MENGHSVPDFAHPMDVEEVRRHGWGRELAARSRDGAAPVQFRRRGKEMVDLICDYYGRGLEERPVRSQVEVRLRPRAAQCCTAHRPRLPPRQNVGTLCCKRPGCCRSATWPTSSPPRRPSVQRAFRMSSGTCTPRSCQVPRLSLALATVCRMQRPAQALAGTHGALQCFSPARSCGRQQPPGTAPARHTSRWADLPWRPRWRVSMRCSAGVTHWQSPSFFAYYPANSSFPAMLGDMLSGALNMIGFSWISSPACTELEAVRSGTGRFWLAACRSPCSWLPATLPAVRALAPQPAACRSCWTGWPSCWACQSASWRAGWTAGPARAGA